MSSSKKTNNDLRESAMQFFENLINYFHDLLDLRFDADVPGTIESIEKYIEIKGYNIWILMASAMIASIGLDMNSAAVIIGAMLISPLMSPILGIGLSVGINDRSMLSRSLYNFLIAVSVSVLTAYLYFLITPLGEITPELQARTRPTLLDVGVAFFGGIAGIVAGSHKDKTNALPGVAIATALMPPLCTVGFGLATMQLDVWGGALYLFFINATIISFTTYLIVRFLNFPLKEHVSQAEKNKTTLAISTLVIAVSFPSVLILWDSLDRINENLTINKFIHESIETNGKRKVSQDWTFEKNDTLPDILTLYLLAGHIPEDSIPALQNKLQSDKYNFSNDIVLNLIQAEVSSEELYEINNLISQTNTQVTTEMMKTIELVEKRFDERLGELATLRKRMAQLDSLPMHLIRKEAQAIYPEIRLLKGGYEHDVQVKMDSLSVTSTDTLVADSLRKTQYILTPKFKQTRTPYLEIKWDSTLKKERITEYEKRLQHYVISRFEYDTISIK